MPCHRYPTDNHHGEYIDGRPLVARTTRATTTTTHEPNNPAIATRTNRKRSRYGCGVVSNRSLCLLGATIALATMVWCPSSSSSRVLGGGSGKAAPKALLAFANALTVRPAVSPQRTRGGSFRLAAAVGGGGEGGHPHRHHYGRVAGRGSGHRRPAPGGGSIGCSGARPRCSGGGAAPVRTRARRGPPRGGGGSTATRLFSATTIVGGDGSESSIPNTEAPSTEGTHASATKTTVLSHYEIGDWKDSPLVNPTITFETLLVPSSQLTKWITHPELQHRLAKPDNWEFLKHVHPRIKLVQDYREGDDNDNDDDDKNNEKDNNENNKLKHKQLLLLPSSMVLETKNQTATGMPPNSGDGGTESDARWLSDLLRSAKGGEDGDESEASAPVGVSRGPTKSMSISSHQLSFQYILRKLLPESALPPPSAYEQIGHVAHFNLKERHLPFKNLIGSALIESTSGDSIRTVVNKVGKVDGKFRTYECEILADTYKCNGPSHTAEEKNTGAATEDHKGSVPSPPPPSSSLETTVVEDGISIQLNVAECYWCTRLSGERQELIKDVLAGRRIPGKGKRTNEPLVVADVFCGAGAVCMLLAKKIKDQDKIWTSSQDQLQKKKKTKKGNGEEQQQQPQQTLDRERSSTDPERPLLTVLANDWNPRAIEYMKRSIRANGMDKEKDESVYHKFELSCRDSYDFLFELGEEKQAVKTNPYIKRRLRRAGSQHQKKPSPLAKDDPRPSEPQQPQQPLPDHVLMNFPLEAPRFLGALRWWSWKRLQDEVNQRRNKGHPGEWFPRFHVYTFARSSAPRVGDEEEMAVNLVANELLPPLFEVPEQDDSDDGTASGDPHSNSSSSNNNKTPSTTTIYRRNELNEEFGTDFSTRMVRDVAPGKVVVCVAFSVTPKLIRYMQGDYS